MSDTTTRIDDRVVIVTGGSGGIGRAICLRFAMAGARVVVVDVRSRGVEQEIITKYGEGRAIFRSCDVASEAEIVALIAAAVEFGGRLDVLVTAAGISETSAVGGRRAHELDTEHWDAVMNINVRGLWLCNKHALKQMLAQEPHPPNSRNERTRGWIVNVASIAGFIATPEMPAYIPSKHAVIGITKQLAVDYAVDRIHVNSLCPGLVRTELTDAVPGISSQLATKHPWQALGMPEDMASGALFLASNESQWITGHALVIDGAYTAV